MSKQVIIDYTNWRGERAERRVNPVSIWYGKTEWHPEEQWLLSAFDMRDDGTAIMKDFAMRDIHSWRPNTQETI
jgi:predicted DNA-binding transcriptional regulator YafY